MDRLLEDCCFELLRLETYLPPAHLEAMREALRAVDAGHVGAYDSCLAYHEVTGCWRPLEGTNPYIGRPGELCEAREFKLEVTIRVEQAAEVVAAVRAAHPYEEPVICLLPLLTRLTP